MTDCNPEIVEIELYDQEGKYYGTAPMQRKEFLPVTHFISGNVDVKMFAPQYLFSIHRYFYPSTNGFTCPNDWSLHEVMLRVMGCV